MYWSNAVSGYVKNGDIYRGPTQTSVTIPGDTFDPEITPYEVGMTYNGQLNAWNATAVDNPSLVPLVWSGAGNTAEKADPSDRRQAGRGRWLWHLGYLRATDERRGHDRRPTVGQLGGRALHGAGASR